MPEAQPDAWRVEKYSDETDPFASIQWFVMRGNVVIAQCEVAAHAERILFEHQRFERYARTLEQIAGMPGAGHDLEAAAAAAKHALNLTHEA